MAAKSTHKRSWSPRQQVFVILAAGLLMRVFYHILLRPWWAGDTGGYTGPFWMWRHGYYSDGARLPVYPLFLAFSTLVTRSRPFTLDNLPVHAAYAAVFLQSALGLCATVLIYDTMRKLGVRDRLAFWGALSFALIAGLSQFEMILLTQSLSVFLLMLSCWLFVRTVEKLKRGENVTSAAIWAGVAFCLTILIRAEILVFFVVLLGCMAFVFALTVLRGKRRTDTQGKSRRTLGQSAGIVLLLMPLAAAPGILGWMYFNYLGSGQFRLTTMMGYQFYQSVYNLYDRVDSQDRVLGQIMVKYYHQTNHDGQIKRDYIWSALDEIRAHKDEMPIKWRKPVVNPPGRFKMEQSIADSVDLGDYMGSVAQKLAKRNPYAWLRNGADNFVRDTFNFNYPSPFLLGQITPSSDHRSVDMKEVLRYPALQPISAGVQGLQAPFLSALYVCTLGLALSGPILLIRNQRSETLLLDGAVLAMVLSTVSTFISFCLLASYFAQYGMPFLGVMIVTFVYALERWLSLRGNRRKAQQVLELQTFSKT